jgi:hypothetical protein
MREGVMIYGFVAPLEMSCSKQHAFIFLYEEELGRVYSLRLEEISVGF